MTDREFLQHSKHRWHGKTWQWNRGGGEEKTGSSWSSIYSCACVWWTKTVPEHKQQQGSWLPVSGLTSTIFQSHEKRKKERKKTDLLKHQRCWVWFKSFIPNEWSSVFTWVFSQQKTHIRSKFAALYEERFMSQTINQYEEQLKSAMKKMILFTKFHLPPLF